MNYPIGLLDREARVAPLFGDQLVGEPHLFDFSSANPNTLDFNPADFDEFQARVFGELRAAKRTWGVGLYLEERRQLLRKFPQMIAEDRVFHVGLDIVVPEGFSLHAPLDAVVFALGMDAGAGNYGGYVILQHDSLGVPFFSFYGHLNSNHCVGVGDRVAAGAPFASIGAREDSGNWFTHTHLQILTESAIAAGRLTQGYVRAADLFKIDGLFPSPYPMFRY